MMLSEMFFGGGSWYNINAHCQLIEYVIDKIYIAHKNNVIGFRIKLDDNDAKRLDIA